LLIFWYFKRMTDALYPETPSVADTSFLKPSVQFKRNAARMILGIALLPLLYIFILILGLVLLFGFGYVASLIISFSTGYLAILIAVFLVMLGIVFFYFTLRFVFGTVDAEEPVQIEVKKKDHPLLFDFIRKVSKDVGAPFPKKIFLTPDVNASVSYSSSFWSMFFPVRKNLHIGLGLVNTLTISEFKATMAHEFAHFSQRSMKTLSYVYTMNRVMFDLVYQRDKLEYDVRNFAETSSIGTIAALLTLFADLTDWFVGSLRKIMYSAYEKINITYVALAREMEFHADLVAVRFAGNDVVINTLRKLELASVAYERTSSDLRSLNSYRQRKVGDLYDYHSKMIPLVTSDDQANAKKRRLKIKSLWATHPTDTEREVNINKVSIQSPVQNDSAWKFFSDPDRIKQQMTSLFYEIDENAENQQLATTEEIEIHFTESNQENSPISKTFFGFYDRPKFVKIDLDKIMKSTVVKSFDQIISPEIGALIRKNYYDRLDLETFILITNQILNVEFFEYDGERYEKSDIKKLRTRLHMEISNDEKKFFEIEDQLSAYFYQRSKELGNDEEFLTAYREFQNAQIKVKTAYEFATRIDTMVRQINNERLLREDQVRGFYRSIQTLEKEVRKFFSDEEPAELWNPGDRISKDGFRQLHQAVASLINFSQNEILGVRSKINDIRMLLVPPQFLRH
jgi:Zn-dependent protease with chaperone function